MPFFQTKPIVVEAFMCKHLMSMAKNNWNALPKWFIALYDKGGVVFTDAGIHIPASTSIVKPEDFIVHSNKGNVYPCKRDEILNNFIMVDDDRGLFGDEND